MVVLAKSSPIMPAALHPNPFIQSLQNAGVDWCWPDYSLSCFWRATQEAMGRAGWPSHTTPWAWDDVHAAYVSRWQGPAALAPRSRGTPRLEPCVASWLDFPQDVLNSAAPMDTLVRFYLARVDLHASDGQSVFFGQPYFGFVLPTGGTSTPMFSPIGSSKQWTLTDGDGPMTWLHRLICLCGKQPCTCIAL